MKLYRMLIRPKISRPDQHYKPVYEDLEQDGKWYAEEEKEAIKEKYKHLENTFEIVVFDVKYEPVPAIPVEWLKQYVSEKWSTYMQAAVEAIIEAWQKEQEVRGT